MESTSFPGQRNPGDGSPRRSGRHALPALVMLAMTALLNAGCSSSGGNTAAASSAAGPVRYMVTADETSFYKYGPAQANGADLKLKRGREVVMLERHYGYSRVQTEEGDSGYVPTDDLIPSPHQPTLASAPIKKPGNGSGSARGSRSTPDFDQPNDVALPSRQQPSDEPVPSFRY